jgi:hypothetical protein
LSTEIKQINDNGEINVLGVWSQPPLKALICAIEQLIYGNQNTWNYVFDAKKYKIKETKRGFAYCYGENSVLYVTT